jgi:hypothetical protein
MLSLPTEDLPETLGEGEIDLLIKEARQKARRRRVTVGLAACAVVLGVTLASIAGGGTPSHGLYRNGRASAAHSVAKPKTGAAKCPTIDSAPDGSIGTIKECGSNGGGYLIP